MRRALARQIFSALEENLSLRRVENSTAAGCDVCRIWPDAASFSREYCAPLCDLSALDQLAWATRTRSQPRNRPGRSNISTVRPDRTRLYPKFCRLLSSPNWRLDRHPPAAAIESRSVRFRRAFRFALLSRRIPARHAFPAFGPE